MESDDALAALAQDDPAAFAALYVRYVDLVYRFCFRRLGDRATAEDATSRIFERALRALPRYRAGSFRSWLFTIAYNTIADLHRSERRVHRIRLGRDQRLCLSNMPSRRSARQIAAVLTGDLDAGPAPQIARTHARGEIDLRCQQTSRLCLQQPLTEIAGLSSWHAGSAPIGQHSYNPLLRRNPASLHQSRQVMLHSSQ